MPEPTNGIKRYLVAVGATLTVTILLQSMTLIWWASNLSTRMQFVARSSSRTSPRACTVWNVARGSKRCPSCRPIRLRSPSTICD